MHAGSSHKIPKAGFQNKKLLPADSSPAFPEMSSSSTICIFCDIHGAAILHTVHTYCPKNPDGFPVQMLFATAKDASHQANIF